MMFRAIWIVPFAAALAACPTYSESSREGAGDEDEVAEAREAGQAGEDEPVLEVDRGDEAEPEADEETAAEQDADEEDGQVEGDSTVMHREDAGEPGDDGWYAARSTNGGFEVEVPAAFDDYEIAPEGEDQKMHVVQAEKDGARYLVQCSVGGEPPADKLAAIEEQLPKMGNVEQQREVRHAGAEGVEFRLAGGETTITIRSLALDDALCQLIVEARGIPYPDRAGARFIQSFTPVEEG